MNIGNDKGEIFKIKTKYRVAGHLKCDFKMF
jgi:hypothetical protein